MASEVRQSLQGVKNIVRFNWPFYVLALVVLFSLLSLLFVLPEYKLVFILLILIGLVPLMASLIISFFIYDRSQLYNFPWLRKERLRTGSLVLNIHAGFDESTLLLRHLFPMAQIIPLDFYDPATHTEPSIKRARKLSEVPPGTCKTSTRHLPVKDESADAVLLFLSAHEIRSPLERVQFFKELHRVLKPDGKIYMTEHLRDFPNFLAYNIGFLHFHSRRSWLADFSSAALNVHREEKTTAFITSFILEKR